MYSDCLGRLSYGNPIHYYIQTIREYFKNMNKTSAFNKAQPYQANTELKREKLIRPRTEFPVKRVNSKKTNTSKKCVIDQYELICDSFGIRNIKSVANNGRIGRKRNNLEEDYHHRGRAKEEHISGIPSTFDSRFTSSMNHKEKVNLWIEMVPISQLNNGEITSLCYTGQSSLYWDEFEFDNGSNIENLDYVGMDMDSIFDKDHQLFIQEQKYDTLVRKIYTLEDT